MKWIGLTGGIGTGKSTVANLFRHKGHPVLDADQFARKAVEKGTECYSKVLLAFGPEVLASNGDLSRKKLADIVFSDKAKLKELEAIVHPEVQKLVEKEKGKLLSQGTEIAFYDVPLLFEAKMQGMFDKIIYVHCDEDKQIPRVMHRDGMTSDEVKARISSQVPAEEKKQQADYILDNSTDQSALDTQVDQVIMDLLLQ